MRKPCHTSQGVTNSHQSLTTSRALRLTFYFSCLLIVQQKTRQDDRTKVFFPSCSILSTPRFVLIVNSPTPPTICKPQQIDSGPSVPPKLPHKPVQPGHKLPDPLLEQYVLGGFRELSISGSPQSSTSAPSNTPFIGGFDPRRISGFETYSAGPSYTSPTAMPVPQSLTMQMALEPVQDNNNLSFCAQSNQLLPPRPQTDTSSVSSSSPARSAISLSSPTKPSNKSDLSISSAQSTSSIKSGGQRCAGVTKAGKQCSRIVKTGSTLLSEDADGSTLLPKFCFQHIKEIMSPSGYYSRKNGEWVKFEGNL